MKQVTPSRRMVLRGALAVGCGLLVPVVLSGCDSKKGSSPAAGAPDAAPAPSAQAKSIKAPQASVKYQGQPNGDRKCGSCLNFIAESNTCMVVDGQVSPTGWYILWTMKA